MNVDILVGRFRDHYGHTDFTDAKYVDDEYAYKLKRGQRMHEWLGRDALRQLIEEANWPEVAQRVVRSFGMTSGPLVRWPEFQWVRGLGPEEQQRFALALEQFLYGQDGFPDRLERFVSQATEAYLLTQERDPAYRKRYGAGKLSWPFVSYFHFMMWPDQEYVFVKPTPLRGASRASGFNIDYDPKPNRVTYASVQEFYRTLWPTVQSLGGRGWIDVQTFIHVAGGGFDESPGDADQSDESDSWAEWIKAWQLEHADPERNATRLRAEQEARDLLKTRGGKFDEALLRQFLKLVNTDLLKGHERHDRFGQAMRGNNAELIAKSVDDFNEWSMRLLKADDAEIWGLLDDFWQRKAIRGAGRTLPTLLLYLHDPVRYNVWLGAMEGGLAHISDYTAGGGKTGAAYQAYNQTVNQVRKRYRLEPQEMDYLLWRVGMLDSADSWQARLASWLDDNPRTMPDELRRLRQEFVERFPKEELGNMTLEQYALGHKNSKNSFCYWLERKTRELGSIRGGSSAKFGVWWDGQTGRWRHNKVFDSAEHGLERIKAGLTRLVEAVEAGELDALDEIGAESLGKNRYSLRGKPLHLYFPDQFLPISNPDHIGHFLTVFGQDPQGEFHSRNRQLLHYLNSQTEFDGFDTVQMMYFLYDTVPPSSGIEPPDGPDDRLEAPDLAAVLDYVDDSAFTFSRDIVTNYHLSLLTKPFVILTGLSGTGKTKLTHLYADAVHGFTEGVNNPYYQIVAVHPDWTDSQGLLGYYNPISRTYEATTFLRFMLRASVDPANWYYICLDEMNLARVEYYFSDFLSALESGEAVALHTNTGHCVAAEAGEGADSVLPDDEAEAQGYSVGGVLYVPSTLPIPPNLAISGTVNVDETTHAFSDKVLDRANSIEFSQVNLDEYARRYSIAYPDREKLIGEVMPLLRDVHALLKPRYLHFGYRTLDEVLAYLWLNETLSEEVRQPREEALDNQVMQKILPKLRGDERIQETLQDLQKTLVERLGEGSRSATKLGWMLDELGAFGSTHFWR